LCLAEKRLNLGLVIIQPWVDRKSTYRLEDMEFLRECHMRKDHMEFAFADVRTQDDINVCPARSLITVAYPGRYIPDQTTEIVQGMSVPTGNKTGTS